MNLIHHKELNEKKWFSKSLAEQMANVGSEVERTIIWKTKDQKYKELAFERTLELIDLTVEDPKNLKRLEEILRVRECLVDYFAGDNIYGSTDKLWQNYFLAFNYLARKGT